MSNDYPIAPDNRPATNAAATPNIVIQNLPPKPPGWIGKFSIRFLLGMSVLANIALLGMYQRYYPNVNANEVFKSGEEYATDKIALIRVSGMITRDLVTSPKKELATAAKDSGVKAVVLAVDSPGGTIAGSDELYAAIAKFKAETQKPIVVSMQGMATSGAYYISMPADRIFADRTCITGSIGVITSLFNVEELMNKVGIHSEVIKSGNMKDSGSPYRKMTDEERKEWNNLIQSMYRQFLAVILKHRSEKVGGEEKLRKLADGRIYTADEALKSGLIDEIGYEEDAINAAKTLAGVGESVRIVTYSRPLGGLLDLFEGHRSASVFSPEKLLEWQMTRPMLLPSSMFGGF